MHTIILHFTLFSLYKPTSPNAKLLPCLVLLHFLWHACVVPLLIHVSSSTLQVKEGLTQHICEVHDVVVKTTEEYFNTYRRHVYVTPKSYLSFINSYKSVYQTKHEELKRLADSINSGLAKLLQAEEDVSKMKVALIQKEKDLAVAQEMTDVLLAEIREKAAVAEVKKNEVQKVKDQLQSEAREIEKEKNEAEVRVVVLSVVGCTNINPREKKSNPFYMCCNVFLLLPSLQ
jgi:hypothetical protein